MLHYMLRFIDLALSDLSILDTYMNATFTVAFRTDARGLLPLVPRAGDMAHAGHGQFP